MNEYPGTPPLYHFDFYRLVCGHEIVELGFEDYFDGHGICIAEWADRLGDLLPEDRLEITFAIAGEEQRTISFEASGPDSRILLERLAQGMPAH
jgi:tRNA threonylcarbamoyladenosine biosynthesis protein TsaE